MTHAKPQPASQPHCRRRYPRTADSPWRGAHVLITGGGSGLGRLLALGAARRGARHVTVWDLSAERAEATARLIRQTAATATGRAVDVADQPQVAEAARQTEAVDILVNNAGVISGRALLDSPPAAIERTLQVNLHALFWVTQAFLGGMVERDRGTVVTIASAAGLIGVARMADYSASKFGAYGFNEALRGELRRADSHVHSLVVCPYYMDTGMFAGVTTRFPKLLPILNPEVVAVDILNAVERGRRQLILPPFVRNLPLLRLLPTAGLDRLADFFGINHGLDDFHGRPGDRL